MELVLGPNIHSRQNKMNEDVASARIPNIEDKLSYWRSLLHSLAFRFAATGAP